MNSERYLMYDLCNREHLLVSRLGKSDFFVQFLVFQHPIDIFTPIGLELKRGKYIFFFFWQNEKKMLNVWTSYERQNQDLSGKFWIYPYLINSKFIGSWHPKCYILSIFTFFFFFLHRISFCSDILHSILPILLVNKLIFCPRKFSFRYKNFLYPQL